MRHLTLIAALVLAGPASAQDGDAGYIASFLQDSLSGAGRTVTIDGFAGALSSQASIQRLTIADAEGVWLTIEGVTLDWSRSSLLSGALVVNELSADQITLARLPTAEPSDLPTPEAAGFALPDLPVTIDIERVSAGQITLGEEVLGQPVEGTLEASLQLAGGAGQIALDLLRTDDGPDGAIRLAAEYDNLTRQLVVDLTAKEDAGGIVTRLLGLPGQPAADFRLIGAGPVEAFAADITLATDGEDRLTGQITLGGTAGGAHQLQATVQGNLAPLLAPDHVDFFGTSVALTLLAERAADGRVAVENFVLSARSFQLAGSATIAADGLPETVAITGLLADPDGGPVLLPLGNSPTQVDEVTFTLDADLAGTGDWRGFLSVEGLAGDAVQADELSLSGAGSIAALREGRRLDGTFRFIAEGLQQADAARQAALGGAFDGTVTASYLQGDDVVVLSDLQLTGDGLDLTGALEIGGPASGFLVSGRLQAATEDLSRFGPLAGVALAGRGGVTLIGQASALSGLVDGTIDLAATGLQVGIATLDRLLMGQSTLHVSILRDERGIDLRSLDLKAGALEVTASGTLASTGASLAAKVGLADLAAVLPGWKGAVSLDARYDGTLDLGRIKLTGTGTGLASGITGIDRVLDGESQLSAALTLRDGRLVIEDAALTTPQLSLAATGDPDAKDQTLKIEGSLTDLGLIVESLRGPLRVAGRIVQDSAGFALDLAGKGPGQVDARAKGRIAADFGLADLALTGSAEAGLANLLLAPRLIEGRVQYDLRLSGPLRLASLSGRVTLAEGRVSNPDLGFAFEGIEALAVLDRGEAAVAITSRMSTGGRVRVDGPVALSPPFDADLAVTLDKLRLFDPELYDATADGAVRVLGPLAGGAVISGAVTLSQAELRVPDSTLGSIGTLPDITHLAEPSDVRATRERAGLLDTGKRARADAGPVFGIDLLIAAPNRIFLRGRGLDAEIGGTIRLAGTTAAIVPSGAFSLVRGRLDILGKRLVLDQADLALEGSFVPMLTISARTESDGITSFVRIDGAADDPQVTFTSTPELPQEDVIARILFGRGLDSLSVLQAVQLANAVAVLAGQSGEGVINRLRKGFGLDDLDVTTAADGSTALTVGKYLTENVYTEVEVGQAGQSRVNLNLDVRPGVTLKARVGDDGETGLGIYVEGDY